MQVMFGEFPFKRLGDGLEVLLEAMNAFFNGLQRGEVIGSEGLPLQHGEIDLDLVQPACMYGAVNEDESRVLALQSQGALGAPMRGAVVDNPEDTSGRIVRGPRHDLVHQAIEGGNAGVALAATEEFGVVYVHGSDVCPGTTTLVLVFDFHARTRIGWDGLV